MADRNNNIVFQNTPAQLTLDDTCLFSKLQLPYKLSRVGGGLAGLTEIKANSASQQSWSWGLAELGNRAA